MAATILPTHLLVPCMEPIGRLAVQALEPTLLAGSRQVRLLWRQVLEVVKKLLRFLKRLQSQILVSVSPLFHTSHNGIPEIRLSVTMRPRKKSD